MSVLFQQHRELGASMETDARAELMCFHLGTATKLLREYRAYTAELRRRYPWPKEESTSGSANRPVSVYVEARL